MYNAIIDLNKEVNCTRDEQVFKILLKRQFVPQQNLQVFWKFYSLVMYTNYLPRAVLYVLRHPKNREKTAGLFGISRRTLYTQVKDSMEFIEKQWGKDFITTMRTKALTGQEIWEFNLVLDDRLKSSIVIGDRLEEIFLADVFKNVCINPGEEPDIIQKEFDVLLKALSGISLARQRHIVGTLTERQKKILLYLLIVPENKLDTRKKGLRIDVMEHLYDCPLEESKYASTRLYSTNGFKRNN